jgi:two-component system OmpR family sensor kinase
MRGLSIRTRITIGTLVVALVLSVTAGVLLNNEVESIITQTTVRLLDVDSAPFEAAIQRDPAEPGIGAAEGQLVDLVRPDGTSALSNLPDYLEDRTMVLRTFDQHPRQIGGGRNAYLVSTESVKTSAGTWKIIVARSMQPGALVIDRLRMTLVIGAAVLFVLFGLASWILSGVALRPVSRMRVKAELLGDVDSSDSLPVGPARDELAALATTLNSFIDRNRQVVEREKQMLSDASHEIRSPLAVLMAQLDRLAVEPGASPAQAELARGARSTARRLSALATNILELSKLEAGQPQASSSWRDLVAELSAATDRARIIAQSSSVVVDFEVEERDGPALYPVSVSLFGRLIDNLLSNAIAASPRGEPVLSTLRRGDASLEFVVVDSGTGMPSDFIGIAFDRFTRPDASRQQSSGGSGLGLAIVAAIVDAARGTVEIENLQPGLRVTVIIPESDTE